MGRRGRHKMAAGVSQHFRVLEGRKELSAHLLWDDTVLLSEHVQGWDEDRSRGLVEPLVLRACAPEPRHQDGEAEPEPGLQVLLL